MGPYTAHYTPASAVVNFLQRLLGTLYAALMGGKSSKYEKVRTAGGSGGGVVEPKLTVDPKEARLSAPGKGRARPGKGKKKGSISRKKGA